MEKNPRFPIGDGDGDAIVTPDGDGDNYLTSGMGMVSTIPRIPDPVSISISNYLSNLLLKSCCNFGLGIYLSLSGCSTVLNLLAQR